MLKMMSKNWWTVALRGLVTALFGLAIFTSPGMTVFVLVTLFGAFAIVDGLTAIFSSVLNRNDVDGWWIISIAGIVGVAVGVATLTWPAITTLTLLYLIAFRAIATGIFDIISAIYLRKEIEGESLMVLGGLFSMVFGGLIIAQPGTGALAILTVLAFYMVMLGILQVILGLRLRGLDERIDEFMTQASHTKRKREMNSMR